MSLSTREAVAPVESPAVAPEDKEATAPVDIDNNIGDRRQIDHAIDSPDDSARDATRPVFQQGYDVTTDHFCMYCFKIVPCSRDGIHNWDDCPFAHPGETANRRDPRLFTYSPEFCQGMRKSGCANGDACGFSHSVFEAWLHPLKYRTQLCKHGRQECTRSICFFAHGAHELRTAPAVEKIYSNAEMQAAAITTSQPGSRAARGAARPPPPRPPAHGDLRDATTRAPGGIRVPLAVPVPLNLSTEPLQAAFSPCQPSIWGSPADSEAESTSSPIRRKSGPLFLPVRSSPLSSFLPVDAAAYCAH
eukprot:jgi/Tetstr1/442757/TSEL_030845.t1